jgi:carboxylate-amine ligase
VAALFRCLIRRLVELPELNAELGPVSRPIAGENKWRAHCYGTSATFVEQRSMRAAPLDLVLQELTLLIRDDAKELDCLAEVSRAKDILQDGSSADEQLRIYDIARANGSGHIRALKQVVDWLHRETIA